MKSESGFSLAMARQPFHLDSLTILQWKALPGLKRSTTCGESHDTRVRPLSSNHEERKGLCSLNKPLFTIVKNTWIRYKNECGYIFIFLK